MTKLGKVLFKKRQQMLMSRKEVAEAMGMHFNTVEALEKGRRNVRIDILKKLCNCYATTLGDLFKEIDE